MRKISILTLLKRKINNMTANISLNDINELFFASKNKIGGPDLAEITYFTCLKTLAENLGKMPVYLIDKEKNRVSHHETVSIFSIAPNKIMTPIQFFSRLEYCRNHYGNGYAYIERENSILKGLHLLDPQKVQVWVNNTADYTKRQYYYRYFDSSSGKDFWIDPENMLHVKAWITENGCYVGKSVLEILAANMAGNKAAQEFLTNLYSHGLTANAVVKYVGDLNSIEQRKLLKRIDEQSRDDARRMITLPVGFDIQPIDLKLTDSQFYELRKYNALQIAAAFGVNPDHLNDYTKSSYNNSAMQNLQFYVNTLLYNVTIYEQEMNRKLLTKKEQLAGLGFKFNVWTILRGDPQQQADVLQKMVQSSVYSVNEARDRLDIPPCIGGDVHMVNGSYVKLEDIGKAYENNEVKSNGDKNPKSN